MLTGSRGMARSPSRSRIIAASTRPPKIPDVAPYPTPSTRMTPSAAPAISSVVRPPAASRVRMSRPY